MPDASIACHGFGALVLCPPASTGMVDKEGKWNQHEMHVLHRTRLRACWTGPWPTPGEVAALRTLFPELADVPLAKLRARACAGETFEWNHIVGREAEELIRVATSRGLKLELVDRGTA